MRVTVKASGNVVCMMRLDRPTLCPPALAAGNATPEIYARTVPECQMPSLYGAWAEVEYWFAS